MLYLAKEIAYLEEYKTLPLNLIQYELEEDYKYLEVLKSIEANLPLNKMELPMLKGRYYKND